MLFRKKQHDSTTEQTTSVMLERIQRLETGLVELRARIEGDAQLRRLTAGLTTAAQASAPIGDALEGFAAAMRKPHVRGRTAGLRGPLSRQR